MSTSQDVPRLYGWRFVILFSYSALSVAVNACLMGYTGNTTTVAEYYDWPVFWVEALAFIPMIMYPVVNMITIPAFNKSTTIAIYFASITMIAVGWLRVLGNEPEQFHWIIVSQVLLGLAQPFVLNYCAFLSNVWFDENGRQVATAVGSMATVLGGAIGSTAGPLFFNEKQNETANMYTLCMFYAILCTLTGLGMAMTFRKAPPTPPTDLDAEEISLKDTMKGFVKLVANRDFMLLLYLVAVLYAIFNSLPVVVNDIFRNQLGFSDSDAGLCMATMLGVGLLSTVILSPLMEKWPSHLMWLRAMMSFVMCSLLYHVLCYIYELPLVHFYVSAGLMGLFTLPCLPIALELAAEYTYPLSADIGVGLVWMLGQVFSVLLILQFRWLKIESSDGETNYNSSLYVVLGIGLSVLPCLVFMRPRYKRREAENPGANFGSIFGDDEVRGFRWQSVYEEETKSLL